MEGWARLPRRFISSRLEKNRNSRLLGHVDYDGQNYRYSNKVVKTDLFPDLDIAFRLLAFGCMSFASE